MALLTFRSATAALLALSLWADFPAADAGQDPLPGKPSDPPALRIPPQSIQQEQAADEERDAAEQGRETAEGGAVERIREMLQGEGPQEETGDPILDGVLDLLRNRGSVLDGSPLDPRNEPREPQPLPEGGLWVPYVDEDGRPRLENGAASGSGGSAGFANETSRFLLAEQLLKTARLLAAEPQTDVQRRRLIDDLRREAARCLSAEAPSPPVYGPASGGHPVPAGHSEAY